MKTLFLKSNLLHIRTNEGEFVVINPGTIHNSVFPCGWSGGVELIHACASDVCTEDGNCDHCREPKKLARLISEEKKEFKPAQPTPNFPKGGTTFTESAYKEVEGKGKLIGHIIDDFKNGKEIFVPAVESSEPQEKRTIEDVKNSVARNAGLKDWDEVYKRILPSQIDPLVNQAIRWSIELYKTRLVSAPSESQEEMWKEVLSKYLNSPMRHQDWKKWAQKYFTITRKPE